MWLHVAVIRIEELLDTVARQFFGIIDILAAAIISLARVAFGVFIGHYLAHGLENGMANMVFRSDQFEFFVLAPNFILDSAINVRVNFG